MTDDDNLRNEAEFWLLGTIPGTYRFIETVARYLAEEITWPDVVEAVRCMTFGPKKRLVDLGWHGYEDAYPQPGTWDELTAVENLLSRDEYRTLDAIITEKVRGPKE